ncbi:unnamed protein product [Calicophoron daubneyi]|uniref:Uncharacterized protein n=1 Tax=Calicophoron daubneyi TaxID=300641 RepID=A0AAV2TK59_CALDB
MTYQTAEPVRPANQPERSLSRKSSSTEETPPSSLKSGNGRDTSNRNIFRRQFSLPAVKGKFAKLRKSLSEERQRLPPHSASWFSYTKRKILIESIPEADSNNFMNFPEPHSLGPQENKLRPFSAISPLSGVGDVDDVSTSTTPSFQDKSAHGAIGSVAKATSPKPTTLPQSSVVSSQADRRITLMSPEARLTSRRTVWRIEMDRRQAARLACLLASEAAVESARKRVAEVREARLSELRTRTEQRQRQAHERRKALEQAEKERLRRITERHNRTQFVEARVPLYRMAGYNVNSLLIRSISAMNGRSSRSVSRCASRTGRNRQIGFGSTTPRLVCMTAEELRTNLMINSNNTTSTCSNITDRTKCTGSKVDSINMSASFRSSGRRKHEKSGKAMSSSRDKARYPSNSTTTAHSRISSQSTEHSRVMRTSGSACQAVTKGFNQQDIKNPETSLTQSGSNSILRSAKIGEPEAGTEKPKLQRRVCSSTTRSTKTPKVKRLHRIIASFSPSHGTRYSLSDSNGLSRSRPPGSAKAHRQSTSRTRTSAASRSRRSSFQGVTSRLTAAAVGIAGGRTQRPFSHPVHTPTQQRHVGKTDGSITVDQTLVNGGKAGRQLKAPSCPENSGAGPSSFNPSEEGTDTVRSEPTTDEEILNEVANGVITDALRYSMNHIRSDLSQQAGDHSTSLMNINAARQPEEAQIHQPPTTALETVATPGDSSESESMLWNEKEQKEEWNPPGTEFRPPILNPPRYAITSRPAATYLRGREMAEREERRRKLELIMSRIKRSKPPGRPAENVKQLGTIAKSGSAPDDGSSRKTSLCAQGAIQSEDSPARLVKHEGKMPDGSWRSQDCVRTYDTEGQHITDLVTSPEVHLTTASSEQPLSVRTDAVQLKLSPDNTSPTQSPNTRADIVAHMLASGRLDAHSRAAAILINRATGRVPTDGLGPTK